MNGQDYEVVEPGLIHIDVKEEENHDEQQQPFQLVPATELTAKPSHIRYLIKDYIPEQSIVEIFGSPGSGKSFVALDMAFCIANGIDWHNRRTGQGTVVCILGEGFFGTGQRLRALEIKHGIPANNLIVSKQPASLTDEQNALWVADAVHQYDPVMIVIDTLSRNFGGGDENSTRDMNAFISNLDLYLKGDATVVLVHHSGHAEKGRARGSSVLNGAVDVEYCISKSESMLTMINTKAKEFEPPKGLSFEMTPQELDWQDEDEEPIKSIVLTESEYKPSNDKSKPRLTGRNEAILAALQRATEQHGIKPDREITERFGGFGIGSGRKVVHVDHWRKEAYLVISSEATDAKRKAFDRAQDTLMKNHIQTLNGFWWLINE